MHPTHQAARLVADMSDVVKDVHHRASARNPRHMLFVFDRDDPTASELFWTYGGLRLQLARGGADDVDVIALRRADGLALLRAEKHAPTIFRQVADQIEAEPDDNVIGVAVAHGGFVLFRVTEEIRS